MAYDGMFGPETVTWKVGREAALLLGGGRALILQVSHPLVAAGVEQHSSFDSDPWRRLYRTIDVTSKIAFGDRVTSRRAAGRLRRVHDTVTGIAPDGSPYAANQPDLLLWVWATLVDTSVLVYRLWVGSLGRGEIERYCEEQRRFALACGVPHAALPGGYGAFRDYFETTVEDRLHPSDDSRRIVSAVLGSGVPRPLKLLGAALNLATVGLLPGTLRDRLGLEWGPARERLLDASAFAIRRLMPLVPSLARELPAARGARRRARAAPAGAS